MVSVTKFLSRAVLFQSAPLREGRCNGPGVTTSVICFNPRPYVRGDGPVIDIVIAPTGVSIRAPT